MPPRILDLFAVLVAAGGTLALLHLLLRFRHRLPLDVANERSLHQGAVPRVGGMAMWGGGMLGAACLAFSGGNFTNLLPVVLAAVALALMSFLDDRRGLTAFPRLIGHLVAAFVVVVAMPLTWVVTAGLVLALAWITNLYNFMDGADGLAGGMALFGFAAYGIAAGLGSQPALGLVCFVIAATAAGFLVFNFHPARVFMGDAGSIPIGFLVGALGLLGWREEAWPMWFPLLVFSPFIVDATLTLVHRGLRRQPVWRAHREHYYQRLVRLGWGHRRTAFAEYGLMLAAAASALALLRLPMALQWGGLLAWAALYCVLAWRIDAAWRAAGEKP